MARIAVFADAREDNSEIIIVAALIMGRHVYVPKF